MRLASRKESGAEFPVGFASWVASRAERKEKKDRNSNESRLNSYVVCLIFSFFRLILSWCALSFAERKSRSGRGGIIEEEEEEKEEEGEEEEEED